MSNTSPKQYLSNKEIQEIVCYELLSRTRAEGFKCEGDSFKLKHYDFTLHGTFTEDIDTIDPAYIKVENLYIVNDDTNMKYCVEYDTGAYFNSIKKVFTIEGSLGYPRLPVFLQSAIMSLFPLMLKESKIYVYDSVIDEHLEKIRNLEKSVIHNYHFLEYDIRFFITHDYSLHIQYITFPTSYNYKVASNDCKKNIFIYNDTIYISDYNKSINLRELPLLLQWLAIRHIKGYDQQNTIGDTELNHELVIAKKLISDMEVEVNQCVEKNTVLNAKISELEDELKKLKLEKQISDATIGGKQEIIRNYKYFVNRAEQ